MQGTNIVIESVINVFKCAFEQTLESPAYYWRSIFTVFTAFPAHFGRFWSVLVTFCWCFSRFIGVFMLTLSLRNPYRKKSGGVKSGDRNGHFPLPTLLSPKESCNKPIVMVAVWAVAQSCRKRQYFSFSSNKKWICQKISKKITPSRLFTEQLFHSFFPDTCHQTPFLDECSDIQCSARGFSALQIPLFL